ncbi:MAG: 16S rRNA (uracil(1498)-N(3))-methyltransferase [Muribaculaceae bacterium]|nr:16S rRNA (uracil(1498)-N(3))-methyltransferase [Muribaculaceae bacterium]
MKNIPRIFAGDNLAPGMQIPAGRDVAHYLSRVMRCRDCLAFGGGDEFRAMLSDDGKYLIIGDKTEHTDPSNDITLYFAPIKRTDDMLNMATQMGVARFVPVITERTVAAHINWTRMVRIVAESAEQSNRNSVPRILPPVKFSELNLSEMVFADERSAYGRELPSRIPGATRVLVGPEGGFSDNEFSALDVAGARGLSLGQTILRAEVAAIITIDRVLV